MAYTKRRIPEATRRTVALRYGCQPGESKHDIPCHWCGALGAIHWHRLGSGKPSAWVTFTHELDHLIPEVEGGSGAPDNIVLACRRCNRSRRFSQPAHFQLSEVAVSPHHRKGKEGNREVERKFEVLNPSIVKARSSVGPVGSLLSGGRGWMGNR